MDDNASPSGLPGRRLIVGVVTVVEGVAAIVVAQRTALTLAKQLTGGWYLREPYHSILIVAGGICIALGALTVVASLIQNVNERAADALYWITALVFAATLVGLGLVAMSYSDFKNGPVTGSVVVYEADLLGLYP